MGDSPIIKRRPAFVKVERKDEEINKQQNNFSQANQLEGLSSQQNNSYPVIQSEAILPQQQPLAQNIVQQYPSGMKQTGHVTDTTTEFFEEPEMLLQNTQTFEMYVVKCKNKTVQKQKCIGVLDQFGYIHNHIAYDSHNKTDFSTVRVSKFVITRAVKIKLDYGYEYNEAICIDCKTALNGDFQVMISTDDFEKRNIKKIIEKHTRGSVFHTGISDSKINNLLYNFIKDICENEQYELKYKPGFYFDDNELKFVSHNDDESMESEVIKNCVFDVRSFEYNEARAIVQSFCHLLKEKKYMLIPILFRLSALLKTPLIMLGYKCEKVLVVSGCESQDNRNQINSCLQIYNRESGLDKIYSLDNVKKNDIQKLALENKDNVLLFNDTQLTDNYKKQTAIEKMNLLSQLFSQNTQEVECQCAVISNRFMNIKKLADETCLFYNMNDWEETNVENELKLQYEFDQVVVDFIKSLYLKFKDRFKVMDEKDLNTFIYSSSRNTYKALSVCLSVLKNICQFYECNFFSEDDYDDMNYDIYDYIFESERFNNEEYIYEYFKDVLNECIIDEDFRLVNNNSFNKNVKDDKQIIYVNDDLLLIQMPIFNDIISYISSCINDKDGINLRKILFEKNMLESNCGKDKYLYRASIAGSDRRPYFIAINKAILNEDAVKKLPGKNQTSYELINADDDVERINLGITEEGIPVYWSIGKGLRNKSIFIRGSIGSGKTYLLLSLAKKLHDIGKRVVIFDYAIASGYDEYELKKVLSEYYIKDNIFISSEATMKNIIEHENQIVVIRSTVEVAENLLMELFDYCEQHKAEERDFYVILDEVASMNITNTSAIGKAILYGRKVNLGLLTATQVLSGDGVRTKTKLLNQAALKIALSLDDATAREVARENSKKDAEAFIETLKELKRGEALVYGELENTDGEIDNSKCVKAKITID